MFSMLLGNCSDLRVHHVGVDVLFWHPLPDEHEVHSQAYGILEGISEPANDTSQVWSDEVLYTQAILQRIYWNCMVVVARLLRCCPVRCYVYAFGLLNTYTS